jgi:hypothetical protein
VALAISESPVARSEPRNIIHRRYNQLWHVEEHAISMTGSIGIKREDFVVMVRPDQRDLRGSYLDAPLFSPTEWRGEQDASWL